MAIPQQGAFARSFGVSPFSILNAREGWWQKRKKQWRCLGLESQLGRSQNLTVSRDAAVFLTKEGKQTFFARGEL